MAILVTGGTGKTSVRLAQLLREAGIEFILASRKGAANAQDGMPAVKFDYNDSTTFVNAFVYPFPGNEKINAVWLVMPAVPDPAPSMTSFIDYARKEQGITRFVFVAGSTAEPGPHHIGAVWQHFIDVGVEYSVLRPTWFMENFSEGWIMQTIKNEGKIFTATNKGEIAFVSANDIAAMAFFALTTKGQLENSYRILGPEFLTYDEIAEKMTKALGRQITHVKVSQDEIIQQYQKMGFPQHAANFMGYLEKLSSEGFESEANLGKGDVQRVFGRSPKAFDTWLEENQGLFRG